MDSVCDQLIQSVVTECTKDENKTLINEKILDPVIVYVGRQLIPYVVFSVVIISVLLSFFFVLVCHVLTTRIKK